MPAMLRVGADPIRRPVRRVLFSPLPAVADDGRVEIGTLESSWRFDGTVLAQYEVMRARARGQLAVVSVPRPGGGKDLALDLLHSGDVGLSHELESQLLSYLNHHVRVQRLRANALPKACMYSSLRLP